MQEVLEAKVQLLQEVREPQSITFKVLVFGPTSDSAPFSPPVSSRRRNLRGATPNVWLCWPTQRRNAAKPWSRRWCTGQRRVDGVPRGRPIRTGRRPFTWWPQLLPVTAILNPLCLSAVLRAIEELTQQKHSLVVQVEALQAKLQELHPSSLREQAAEAEVGHAHFCRVEVFLLVLSGVPLAIHLVQWFLQWFLQWFS